MGICKLCGRDASRTKELWDKKYRTKGGRIKLKGGFWNPSTELFCPHHSVRIGWGKVFPYHGGKGWDWTRFGHEYRMFPSDERIAAYVCDYLLKLARRKVEGRPLVECQALFNWTDIYSEGYKEKCSYFAEDQRDGKWVCGRHSLTSGRLIKSISYEDESRPISLDIGEILLTTWNREKEIVNAQTI